jgi:hypothetical protein
MRDILKFGGLEEDEGKRQESENVQKGNNDSAEA